MASTSEKYKSPFRGIRVNDDEGVEVHVLGKWWELISFNGVDTSEVIQEAKRANGDSWGKMVIEFLPEILLALGRPFVATVECTLRGEGETTVVTLPAQKESESDESNMSLTVNAMNSIIQMAKKAKLDDHGVAAAYESAINQIERSAQLQQHAAQQQQQCEQQ